LIIFIKLYPFKPTALKVIQTRDFLQAYMGFRSHFLRELQNISNAKYNLNISPQKNDAQVLGPGKYFICVLCFSRYWEQSERKCELYY